MNEDQTQNLNQQPVTLETLAAQMLELTKEFREFRAFVEPKLYDTRPIWERALAEILEVKIGLEKMEKNHRLLERRLDVYTEDLVNLRHNYRDLEHRVDEMESPRA